MRGPSIHYQFIIRLLELLLEVRRNNLRVYFG